MSRITNVHAMLAQRVTGSVVRPAEHTARGMKRVARGDNTWPSIISFSYVDTMLLPWLDAEETVGKGNESAVFHYIDRGKLGNHFSLEKIYLDTSNTKREQPSRIVCRLAGAAEL